MSDGPDLATLAIALALLGFAVLWPLSGLARLLRWTDINPGETALLYRFGRYRGELGPGRYILWPWTTMRRVATNPRSLTVRGMEATSADGWPTLVSAAVTFQVMPGMARAVMEADVLNPVERVRHHVELALLELTDRTALADLVASRKALDDALRAEFDSLGPLAGITVTRLRVSRVRFPVLGQKYLARLAAERQAGLDPRPPGV